MLSHQRAKLYRIQSELLLNLNCYYNRHVNYKNDADNFFNIPDLCISFLA